MIKIKIILAILSYGAISFGQAVKPLEDVEMHPLTPSEEVQLESILTKIYKNEKDVARAKTGLFELLQAKKRMSFSSTRGGSDCFDSTKK